MKMHPLFPSSSLGIVLMDSASELAALRVRTGRHRCTHTRPERSPRNHSQLQLCKQR